MEMETDLVPKEAIMESDDKALPAQAPETVTIESDSEEDDGMAMVERSLDDFLTTLNRQQEVNQAGAAFQINKRNQSPSEPDFIDLTNDEDDDVMIVGESHNLDQLSEPEDRDMLELIDVEPLPQPTTRWVAEDRKRKGNEYFKVGDYYQALGMYTKAVEALPTDASYYGNRSACYMMLRKYKEALDDIRTSLRLDSMYSKGYLRLIRTTLALGNVTECEMAFSTVTKLGLQVGTKIERERLDRLKKHLTDIEATKIRKDYRKLVFLTTQGLDIASADNNLKTVKADALVRIGRYVEAQELCMEVLQNDMRCPEALYIRAMCLYMDDNLDKSIQFVRQGLQYAPDNNSFQLLFKKLKQVKELREEARMKFLVGRFEESKQFYNLCLASVSTGEMNNISIQAKLHFNLALIAQKINKLDESLEACGKAIELNSKYLKALIHRARVYALKEMYDDAVDDFEAALKLDPFMRDLQRELQNAQMLAKRAKRKDYYKILQVDRKATEDQIRKAYKKKALLHHPDRHASAPEAVQKEQERLFKDLGEAYEVLSDVKKRFRYDQGVDYANDRGLDSPNYESSNANMFNVFFNSSSAFRPNPFAGATRGRQHYPQPGFRHY